DAHHWPAHRALPATASAADRDVLEYLLAGLGVVYGPSIYPRRIPNHVRTLAQCPPACVATRPDWEITNLLDQSLKVDFISDHIQAPFRSARRMAFLPRRSGSNFSLRSISASPFTSTSNCIVIRSLTDPFAQLLARRVRTPATSRPVPDPDPFHPRKAFQADHGLIFVQTIKADALPEQPVNVIYAKANRLSRRIGQHRQA